jgi:selenocysteine lyase/cysteine desulfurase
VHAAPHQFLDMTELGADFVAVSGYTFCGPHVTAVVARPDTLARLEPDRLLPAPDRVPERFEEGTPPFELYAGLTAAVDHLAGLGGDVYSPRRDRLRTSMAAVAAYETELFERLDGALRTMPHVQVLPAPSRRAPTLSFTVAPSTPRHVVAELARRGVCAWDDDGYARELFDALGVTEAGGAVRLGVIHYNTVEEIDRAVEAIDALAR